MFIMFLLIINYEVDGEQQNVIERKLIFNQLILEHGVIGRYSCSDRLPSCMYINIYSASYTLMIMHFDFTRLFHYPIKSIRI